jgi:trk system potassium uptake protein TrkA
MRVIIAGGGRAGLSVAVQLQRGGHQVTIIERDESLARRITEAHGVVALGGDATDAEILREAEAHRADVVGAMLRRDADNLAVALLALSSGARRVMVRMRDPAYRPVYKAAGIERVLSETDVFVGAFGTAIEFEAVHHAMLVGNGESVAFELIVPADAAVVGQSVAEISSTPGFPGSCVVAGLSREGMAAQRVRGSSVIDPEMSVLLVAPRDALPVVIAFFMRTREG